MNQNDHPKSHRQITEENVHIIEYKNRMSKSVLIERNIKIQKLNLFITDIVYIF